MLRDCLDVLSRLCQESWRWWCRAWRGSHLWDLTCKFRHWIRLSNTNHFFLFQTIWVIALTHNLLLKLKRMVDWEYISYVTPQFFNCLFSTYFGERCGDAKCQDSRKCDANSHFGSTVQLWKDTPKILQCFPFKCSVLNTDLMAPPAVRICDWCFVAATLPIYTFECYKIYSFTHLWFYTFVSLFIPLLI